MAAPTGNQFSVTELIPNPNNPRIMGYASQAPRIRKQIISIEIVTIEHEFFGNQPVDVFEIKIK